MVKLTILTPYNLLCDARQNVQYNTITLGASERSIEAWTTDFDCFSNVKKTLKVKEMFIYDRRQSRPSIVYFFPHCVILEQMIKFRV